MKKPIDFSTVVSGSQENDLENAHSFCQDALIHLAKFEVAKDLNVNGIGGSLEDVQSHINIEDSDKSIKNITYMSALVDEPRLYKLIPKVEIETVQRVFNADGDEVVSTLIAYQAEIVDLKPET